MAKWDANFVSVFDRIEPHMEVTLNQELEAFPGQDYGLDWDGDQNRWFMDSSGKPVVYVSPSLTLVKK